jgi:hypothetical protein
MSADTEKVQSEAQDELATLKARADLMGVKYHPSVGLEKLREKVNAAVSGVDKEDGDKEPEAKKAAVESAAQKHQRLYDDAMALVRVRISCMNPAKREWEGEIFTVGNNTVGSVTKYVPFNNDEGWHVPRIMLNMLQERQCQIFVTEKAKNGVSIRKGKLIKEFAIEVLPSLTQEELKDLAQRQAMAKEID